MKLEKLFPAIMIALQLLAALAYIPSGNWRQVFYWLAAAVLTFCVTF